MYFSGMLLALLLLMYGSYSMITYPSGDRTLDSLIKVDPRHGKVGNPNVLLKDDCALRAFTIEMAGYIAPAFWKNNWTALSESAFQMNECNETTHRADRSSHARRPAQQGRDAHRAVLRADARGPGRGRRGVLRGHGARGSQ